MAIRPTRRPVPLETTAQAIYHRSIAKHVHALLHMGYTRMTPHAFQHCEEPAITGELVTAIRAATETPDAPRWVRHYTIHDDPPLNTGGRQGRHRRRVDIEFERAQYGPRPRFQFEAKRLCNASSVGHYLGPEGLGCFLAAEDAYAQEHHEAGMLGYIQVDTESAWAARIQAGLEQSPTRHALLNDGVWHSVVMNPSLQCTYCTKHDRAAPQLPLTIYHVLLRFC